MLIKIFFLEYMKKYVSICDKFDFLIWFIFVVYCLKLVLGIYMYVKEFMNKIDVFLYLFIIFIWFFEENGLLIIVFCKNCKKMLNMMLNLKI